MAEKTSKMTERRVDTATDQPSSSELGKRPYEKPRILTRDVLEAVAATCVSPGKGAPPPICDFSES